MAHLSPGALRAVDHTAARLHEPGCGCTSAVTWPGVSAAACMACSLPWECCVARPCRLRRHVLPPVPPDPGELSCGPQTWGFTLLARGGRQCRLLRTAYQKISCTFCVRSRVPSPVSPVLMVAVIWRRGKVMGRPVLRRRFSPFFAASPTDHLRTKRAMPRSFRWWQCAYKEELALV